MPVVKIEIECHGPMWVAEYEGGRPLRRHVYRAPHFHELIEQLGERYFGDYPEFLPEEIVRAAQEQEELRERVAQEKADADAKAAEEEKAAAAAADNPASNEAEKSDNGSGPVSLVAGTEGAPIGITLTDTVSKVLVASGLADNAQHAANLLKNGGIKLNGIPLRRDDFKAEDFPDGRAIVARSSKKDARAVHLCLLTEATAA